MAKILIIGGGLGGLAGGIRLAKMGYDVELFEKNERLGGKMNELFLGSYRFDTGPSLITMPFILDELFEFAGFDRKAFFEFVPVEPVCRYFFSDGSILNAFSNRDKMTRELEQFAAQDCQAFNKFMAYSKRIYDVTTDVFVLDSIHEWSRLLRKKTAARLLKIGQIDAFRTVHDAVSSFFTDERLIQMFDRYPTYNGSDPFQAPATLNTIPYVEYGIGGFYIKGGVYRLVEALEGMAKKLGMKIHTRSPVEKIVIHQNKISGIRVNGKLIPADVVLCNADVVESFNHLIDGYEKEQQKLNSFEPSISGMVFFWGVRGQHEQLAHHNIFFSNNYRQEFKHIFESLSPADDPTVYVSITGKTDPSHAPEQSENWFVLVNMPYLRSEQNWQHAIEHTRRAVMKKLKHLGIDLADKIEREHIHTPEDYSRLYGSNKGSIYGISSNDRNMAFRRPANRSKKIKGLYFASGSAHPGGGVPLVIQSGRIAAELISERVK